MVSKLVIASLLVAVVLSSQAMAPLKATVLEAKQSHAALSPVTKEEKVLVQNIHQQYMRANAGGDGAKVDTQIQPGSPSVGWTLQYLKNGMVAFKSNFGTYLRCQQGFQARCDLTAKRNPWGEFEKISNDDGTVSFKTVHNSFLQNWPGEGANVLTYPSVVIWERFRLIPNDNSPITAKKYKEEKVLLKSIHGTYCKPNTADDRSIVNCQGAISPRTTWTLEKYSNGRVALRSTFGTYLSVLPGLWSLVEMRKTKGPSPRETYDLISNADGTTSFNSMHGNYFRAWPGEGGKLDGGSTILGAWERFSLVPA